MNPKEFLRMTLKSVCFNSAIREAEQWLNHSKIKTMEEAWKKCPNDLWMQFAIEQFIDRHMSKSKKRQKILNEAKEWYNNTLGLLHPDETTFKKGANLFRKSVKNPFKGI